MVLMGLVDTFYAKAQNLGSTGYTKSKPTSLVCIFDHIYQSVLNK